MEPSLCYWQSIVGITSFSARACVPRLSHLKLEGKDRMSRIGGVFLTVTGLFAYPCHLIISLPLMASLLAGMALDNLLSRKRSLVYRRRASPLFDQDRSLCENDVPVTRTCLSDGRSNGKSHLFWLKQRERSYDDLNTRTL